MVLFIGTLFKMERIAGAFCFFHFLEQAELSMIHDIRVHTEGQATYELNVCKNCKYPMLRTVM